MKITTSILLISFVTLFTFGQNATLLKNYNPKVKELKHNLNTTKDSLLLDCEKTIHQVDIFNEDFEKIITVDSNSSKIALNDMPEGKFVVEVKLVDKIVVMHLVIYQNIRNSFTSTSDRKEIAEGVGMMLDEGLNVIKRPPNMSLEYLLNNGKVKTHTPKSKKLYWTVFRVNNEISSSKTMRLVDKTTAERMIITHKLEHQSPLGTRNQLIIWEVYDTTKFMEQQLVNPDFVYSVTSEHFNTTPYFSSEQSGQNM